MVIRGLSWDDGKLREAGQGGVRELGTVKAEEIAGVLGSVETGSWEEHGRSREEHGKLESWEGAGESREERGGSTGIRKM